MSRFRTQAGFSLIDLAVAITIIGITLAASIPALSKLGQSNNLLNSTEQVAGHLRLARQKAVTRGVPHILAWDEWTQQYVIVMDQNGNGLPDSTESREGPFDLPFGVTLQNSTTQGFTASLLTFSPGGSASESGTVILSNNRGDEKNLSVLAPTGHVRVH